MRGLRTLAAGAATICAVGVIAGCATTVNGSGSLGSASAAPTGSGSSTSVPTGAPTGFPSSATTSAPTGAANALQSYLIASPAGSQRGTSTWATTTAPSVEAFVQHFYDANQVAGEVTRLQTDGITDVAHNLFLYRGLQADVILLRFGSATGAQTRYNGIVAATRLDTTMRTGPTSSTVPGLVEFYDPTVDKLGNIASRAYGIKGNITIEVFTFTPKVFDSTSLTSYASAQYTKLP